MESYIIHSPHLLNEKGIEFVLTEGGYGLFMLYKDKPFIEKLLVDLNIKNSIKDYEIKPFRCFYFSEYPDESWEDKWYICWKVIVSFREKILLKYKSNNIGTNANGLKEIEWFPNQNKKIACLVISDFKSEEELERAKKSILLNSDLKKLQAKFKAEKPIFSRAITENASKKKFFQLIINLGEFTSKYYKDGANYSQEIIKVCQENKGETHFYHL